ncbi:acyltransferase family protein [Pedobacter sp. AW31-3R]|uniref:acyltransferase family protein n=1 Tax=Pedobacter sp. AW31-3R TaxID=3445781 RepID=UPI003FA0966F
MFKKLTDRTTFESIELLRFPLMLLVVFVHVIPPELYPVKLGWDPHRMYTFFSELISHLIGRIAVPAFFLFSGYFFFLKLHTFNARIYIRQLSKRWSTLLFPYLLWIMLYVLVVVLKNSMLGKLGAVEDEMYAEIKEGHYYDIFWGGPLLYPFWYIRDLICMVILSPVFYLLFKYLKGLGLFLLAGSYLMVWESGIPGLSTTAFFFFGAGTFFGIKKYDLMALGLRYKYLKLLAAVIFLGIATYWNATPDHEYWIRPFIISGVLAALCLGTILTQTKKLKSQLLRLSSTVFFLYAVHALYIINWLKGGFAKLRLPDQGWGKLLVYFTIPIACTLICLCLYALMKRFFPKVLAVLTGGRITVKSLET